MFLHGPRTFTCFSNLIHGIKASQSWKNNVFFKNSFRDMASHSTAPSLWSPSHLLLFHPPLLKSFYFPSPSFTQQVWWPPWPSEPFHVVIPLASLGQSTCSSNLLVAGYLHRLQLQASKPPTLTMCLSPTLSPFSLTCSSSAVTLTSHFTSLPYSSPREMWHTCQDPHDVVAEE